MRMSKSLKVILSFVFVVFLALAAIKTEARTLNYRDLIRGDHDRLCDKAKPGSCTKQPVNPYRRGCEGSQHCRVPSPEKM
ncbi:hypothetical protein EUTSA_v10024053mg [Eutrema salsugineum]|uniref:Uncharacterized protein n=1 Tax=Eutrema salsugineum TaxID=72664 RepID=V4KDR9_EUTSA|nr:hypothetical protein EUTSA_v10024053mg [Eutrema salsugineum]